MSNITIAIVLFPLLGALVAGLLGKKMGCTWSHRATIFYVFISFVLSLYLAKLVFIEHIPTFNLVVYHWGISGGVGFDVGFLIDQLSVLMLLVVTFVSLLVHIYSIGYMQGDPGYQRFFSYVSFFTFAMLALVTANNFLQLFFGWEGVGVASYLLIGFWFNKDSATAGSLKAFIVNRVGDFGFLLGIAAILATYHSIDYSAVFAQVDTTLSQTITVIPQHPWSVITLISLLLFVGAMGKSAQIPLHVWLPESMEGPTPISALIHAATMVTAGIYMIARMSPLYQHSPTALSVILVIGASGALFTGLIAIVQNDIKRVIAYSTLSQLGYMVAALGASAYTAAIFHLSTHACFKALLFLGAGSVILACHHEQDMRKMGGLWKLMPITYLTYLLGSLALCALPPFSGFFSKDAIIDAVHQTTIPGAHYAYFCVLTGSFVTAFYTFRSLFMTFHQTPRYDTAHLHPHESPWVVWLPLVLLAIPSVLLGAWLVKPLLFDTPPLLAQSVVPHLMESPQTAWSLMEESIHSPAFWLVISGIFSAWLCYIAFPALPKFFVRVLSLPYFILIKKYGFDDFNRVVFVDGSKSLAQSFSHTGDQVVIDNFFVNGSGRAVVFLAKLGRKLQSGLIYHYSLLMAIGLIAFLILILWPLKG
ncbi:MAG: NADH-quinone oxidoreductase subunit L [Gammaproteobacteria bacterium]|nr:NADH-quinone oxidoreductase subunit L [Gammaproteobacteria bacterium]